MVAARAPSLEQLQRALRFLRRPGDDFAEELGCDAAGAGAGDQEAAGLQQAHGAVVDLAIGAQRAVESFLAFRERRRIQDDRGKLPPFFIEGAQRLDGVGRARFDILQTVALGILQSALHRRRVLIDCDHVRRLARQLQREATVVAERVQRLAACQLAGAQVVFGLVQISAGLVIGGEIDLERDLPFVNLRLEVRPEEGLRPPRQALEVAGAAVVAGHHGAGAGQRNQDAHQLLAPRLRPLGEVLHRRDAVVPVDEIPGQEIRLAVQQAKGVGVRHHRAAPLERAPHPRREQLLVELAVVARDHPQRDGALHRPETARDEVGPRIRDAHLRSGDETLRRAGHVGAEDPRMPCARPRGTLLRHGDGRSLHQRSLA